MFRAAEAVAGNCRCSHSVARLQATQLHVQHGGISVETAAADLKAQTILVEAGKSGIVTAAQKVVVGVAGIHLGKIAIGAREAGRGVGQRATLPATLTHWLSSKGRVGGTTLKISIVKTHAKGR